MPVLLHQEQGHCIPAIPGSVAAKPTVSRIMKDANGKEYFEFETKCAGTFNCDQKMRRSGLSLKQETPKHLKR